MDTESREVFLEEQSENSESPAPVVPLERFLRRRFRGDKSRLCVFILEVNKQTKYRYKYTANFFQSRTFDQLVEFCVRIVQGDGVGQEGPGSTQST